MIAMFELYIHTILEYFLIVSILFTDCSLCSQDVDILLEVRDARAPFTSAQFAGEQRHKKSKAEGIIFLDEYDDDYMIYMINAVKFICLCDCSI